jgi:hypothetical protein
MGLWRFDMRPRFKIGESWGSLTVTDVRKGLPNEYDGFVIRTYYKLRCKCGNEFEIDSRGETRDGEAWGGKNVTRDCGCRIDKGEDRSASLTVTIPIFLYNQISRRSFRKKISKSKATAEALRVGFEYLEYMEAEEAKGEN